MGGREKLQNSWMHAAAQLARERAVDGFVPVFDGCGHPFAQRSRVSTVFVCAASSRPAFVCAASSGPVRE